MYIVIEGQDAVGKDTQAALLVDYFQKRGRKVVHYTESGTDSEDSFVAEIAKLTYGSKQDIEHRTRVLLYLVNRYEQWRKLAEPALKAGDVVITTRNWLSTLIYEGYGGKVSREIIIKLHKTVMPGYYFKPDKIVVLTISEAERKKRLASQGRQRSEVWKSQSEDFHLMLNRTYLKVAKEYGIPTLDASGTVAEVYQLLLKQFGLVDE